MVLVVTSIYRGNRRLVMAGLCCALSLAVAGPTMGADTFDGVYTGRRVLTKGSTQQCVPSENVSVTIQGEALTFTDSALRKFAIGFNPHPDGSFGLISTAISGGSVLIRGRVVAGVLDADVTNGPCEHHWHLTESPQGPSSARTTAP
jgi:hypothetical protein